MMRLMRTQAAATTGQDEPHAAMRRCSGWTGLMRRRLSRIPGHESTAFLLSGLLVMGAIVSGDAESGHLKLSLGMIALAAALGWIKLATAACGPAPGSATASRGTERWMVWALAGLILLHCGIAWQFVRTIAPRIDCCVFQRDSAIDLLHGADPYGATRPDIYDAGHTALFYTPRTAANGRVLVGIPYPPVTFLSVLPGLLMGDLRLGYIGAFALAAVIVYAAMPGWRGLVLAILLLMNPIAYMVEAMCWTEPLVWLLLCASYYAARKRPGWLPLMLGLFLASKQYNILALPLLVFWLPTFAWRSLLRIVGGSLAVAAATLLPFAIWNFPGLWHDLVWYNLAEPLRNDSISFAVLFPSALKIGPLLVLAFILWALAFAARRVELFPAAYATVLLLFVATNKAAFNYYFLIAQCFFLSAAALWPERRATVMKQAFAAG